MILGLMIYVLLITSCINMMARKVKGTIFLLFFWIFTAALSIIGWINGFNNIYEFDFVLENKMTAVVVSVAASFTLFLWLFNIQRVKQIKEDSQ